MLRGTLHALAVLALAAAAPAGAQSDWLSLCGKCLSPSITSKSGIGTSNAVAEGRTTRRDAEGWCANWEPGKNQAACVGDQLAAEDAKKTYRAVADCPGGKITAIDGQTYTLAGKWTSDVGKGRTRWRDAGGNIVGQDNASNGLAISQQWEVLCPVSVATARPAAPVAGAQGSAPSAAQGIPGAQYTAGQIIEAKYGTEWLRGRIDKVVQTAGPKGPEIAYDVRLENGKRGVLPARMLRNAPGA